MRAQLIRHPDSPPGPVSRITVDAERHGGRLAIWFLADGPTDQLVVPEPSYGRADDLWRTTCFEAFVRAEGADGYVELNLSPSGRWQAYALDGYREGRRDADVPEPDVRSALADAQLHVAGRLELWEALPADAAWTLAISAVLEHADGGKSYWALAHAPGAPDFHHPSAFTLTLA